MDNEVKWTAVTYDKRRTNDMANNESTLLVSTSERHEVGDDSMIINLE